MQKQITKQIEITITIDEYKKGEFCDAGCIFRSMYVNSICKLYKKELDSQAVHNVKGLVSNYAFYRSGECMKEFGI